MKLENKDKQAFAASGASGLTKREYFASMAMQGLISSDDYLEIESAKELAKIAVSHADALLEELAK